MAQKKKNEKKKFDLFNLVERFLHPFWKEASNDSWNVYASNKSAREIKIETETIGCYSTSNGIVSTMLWLSSLH